MEINAIEVNNLSVNYLGTPVLKNVNFEVPKAKMVGIIGPNGAGKSTLIKSMLGLIKSTGNISMDGKLAYMKQGSDYDLSFPILVNEVVMLGMYPSIGLFKRPKRRHRLLVEEALKRVGMEDFGNRQIAELSGGQWQRVLIARILVQDADVIFLDEPFTGIDVDSEAHIVEILREQWVAGKSIFIVHHNLDSATDYFDEVILLNKSVIACGAPPAVLTDEILKDTYMRGDRM